MSTKYVYKTRPSWRYLLWLFFRHPKNALRWALQRQTQIIRVSANEMHILMQPGVTITSAGSFDAPNATGSVFVPVDTPFDAVFLFPSE